MLFSKTAITYDEQIEKLERRGLYILDRDEARHDLRHVVHFNRRVAHFSIEIYSA